MQDIDNEFPDRKDIDEVLDEANLVARQDNSVLPEAPASANVRVKTKSGRQWQITMRTSSMKKLVEQIEAMDDLFNSKGWDVPNWQKEEVEPVKEVIDTASPAFCHIHQTMMKERTGKYGKFYSHNINGSWCNGKQK